MQVKIYTTPFCPYCIMAKQFLKKKSIAYEEIGVSNRSDLRAWLREATGMRTVPQIFIGERSIGGFSDMKALDATGEFDALLNASEKKA